jgi:hypothetical protein
MTNTYKITGSDAVRLAVAFSMKMQIAVAEETLWKIILSNRATGRGTTCASHNYCDAAEVMREAWESLWNEPFNWDSALVEAAWSNARGNEFYF